MADSAERRARRKLLAEAYNALPSRESLQAAAEFERVKMQRASQSIQMALQEGSLAVAVLSQLPRDDEHNKPVFAEARNLLLGILKKGLESLEKPDIDDANEDDIES